MSELLSADIDGVSVRTGHLIGGEWVGSSSTFETRSPLDWSNLHLADISRGDAATSEAAVSAAVAGFEAWGKTTVTQRAEVLHRLADLIDDNTAEIAHLECLDMGFLEESMKLRLVGRGALNFRTYADLIVAHEGRLWEAKGMTNAVQRMPAGPAVVITPWNAPFMLATWKLAPALAAGNSVVHKPAEWSPLSAALLAELTVEAGFPPGVFNLVQGIGAEVGPPMVSDPRVRRISFTGSPATGRVIGKSAAENIVPFTAELGGKGPFLVFEDADLDLAAQKAAWQFDDSGQVCLAATRLLVHSSIREPFLEQFNHYADQLVLGDSRDPATDIAPSAHPDHRQRIHEFVERARAAGDTVVRGGRMLEESLHYEPTLIEPVSNDSEVVQSEVFGPVLTFQTFDDEAEAVQLANSTRYGLSAVVYTSSQQRAERVGAAIRAGLVWVNTFLVRDITAPFGGTGISGIGREGGDYALDFHSDLKTLMVLDDTTS